MPWEGTGSGTGSPLLSLQNQGDPAAPRAGKCPQAQEDFNPWVLSSPLGWLGECKEGGSGTGTVPTMSHPEQHQQRGLWEAAPLPPGGPGGLQGGGIKVPALHWGFCPRAASEAPRAGAELGFNSPSHKVSHLTRWEQGPAQTRLCLNIWSSALHQG